jgi:CubicO group peptidase (beta-lactamase class C family)
LDLMRHTSGFTYGFLGNSAVKRAYDSSNIANNPDISGSEFITRLAALPLQFQPGTAWGYGVSTEVLGHIVEAIADMPLDEFIATRITEPLQMPDTAFWVEESKQQRLAEPQVDAASGKRPPMREVGKRPARFNGGGGMVSTAADYARFCQFWLNGGELDGNRLISRKTVELMTSDHLPPDIGFDPETAAFFDSSLPSPAFGYGFGLGFAVRTHPGRNPAHGSVGEFYWLGATGPNFWIDPREKLSAVLMVQVPFELMPYFFYLTRALVYQAVSD